MSHEVSILLLLISLGVFGFAYAVLIAYMLAHPDWWL